MASSHGQKVTNDPRANDNINEAPGIIASDSLAGESLKSHGSFGAGNPKAGASAQPASSMTANTTDDHAARKLDPAPDAETREAQEGWSETLQQNAATNLGNVGGGRHVSGSSGGGGHGGDAVTGGYAGAGFDAGSQKPKGKNIKEGGFDWGAPNASFNNEIGTKKDPGRVAEDKMQLRDAETTGAAGSKHVPMKENEYKSYEALKSEENA
ncbi:hypothetical protein M011DRAFT_445750 [Sporormia fimetaria CBS 119925]|uniref:Uncharacterized protein n=1 Tax=Sporormia fimetaria CBS 119925 TaxID=1340428 RepID=A0A6A6VAX8_9PLEO|nr:hypothetical protein M011DRAFT_445750 [Sporormia fimetaria CBS 119925]